MSRPRRRQATKNSISGSGTSCSRPPARRGRSSIGSMRRCATRSPMPRCARRSTKGAWSCSRPTNRRRKQRAHCSSARSSSGATSSAPTTSPRSRCPRRSRFHSGRDGTRSAWARRFRPTSDRDAGWLTSGRRGPRGGRPQRGNPAGAPVGSRHRQQLNGEFIAALLRDFRQGGPKAIERVRRTQPAAYLKILALLVPREHKVEYSNSLKNWTDEELEAGIDLVKQMLEPQAGGSVRLIEGRIEPAAATAYAPKPKNRLMLEADTAVGPRERTPRKV